MEENKTLGGIKDIKLDLDAPLEMKHEMSLRELTISCGLNGTGKSLLLKLNWCINYICCSYLKAKELGITNFQLLEFAQQVFDKSFEDQDFNGKIECNFDKPGNDIILEFEKGKLLTCDLNLQSNIISSANPIFMSTETRTYNDIKKYLILRKSLGIKGLMDNSNSHLFEQVLEHYRLYDIMFIERLIARLQKPLIFNKDLKDALKKFDLRFEIESIGLDENKPELYFIDKAGEVKSLTILSKGEQSLVNMITANYLCQ